VFVEAKIAFVEAIRPSLSQQLHGIIMEQKNEKIKAYIIRNDTNKIRKRY